MKRAPQAHDDAEKTMWDAVERSRGGHERRWRLMRPMTADEAREWAETHSLELRRAEAFLRPDDRATRARAYPAPQRLRCRDSGETA